MTVHIVVINHAYGTDVWAKKSNEKAVKSLANYCREWWSDIAKSDDDVPPEDDYAAIKDYFERNDEEWAFIRETEVE